MQKFSSRNYFLSINFTIEKNCNSNVDVRNRSSQTIKPAVIRYSYETIRSPDLISFNLYNINRGFYFNKGNHVSEIHRKINKR